MRLIISALGIVTVLTLSSVGSAQTVQKKGLTLDGAKKAIPAAIAEAKSKNVPDAAIAVVDEGGNLVAVERLDNTFAASAQQDEELAIAETNAIATSSAQVK